jgi:hypothetical protein
MRTVHYSRTQSPAEQPRELTGAELEAVSTTASQSNVLIAPEFP